MGFITEEVVQARQAVTQAARDEKVAAEQRVKRAEEDAERLRQAELESDIAQFCSQESLHDIAAALRDAIVHEYLARGYVSCVRIFWEMPESLYHNDTCTRALLIYLQVLEPKTKEVELSRRAFGMDLHGKSVIEVYFTGPLTVT